MTATFTPPLPPSPGLTDEPEVKLLEAEFGDGYTQTTRAGLNHVRSVVALNWDLLTTNEAEAIVTFFKNKGGDTPFLYRVPGTDTAVKWTCRKWTKKAVEATAGNLWSVTATLREDFSL